MTPALDRDQQIAVLASEVDCGPDVGYTRRAHDKGRVLVERRVKHQAGYLISAVPGKQHGTIHARCQLPDVLALEHDLVSGTGDSRDIRRLLRGLLEQGAERTTARNRDSCAGGKRGPNERASLHGCPLLWGNMVSPSVLKEAGFRQVVDLTDMPVILDRHEHNRVP